MCVIDRYGSGTPLAYFNHCVVPQKKTVLNWQARLIGSHENGGISKLAVSVNAVLRSP